MSKYWACSKFADIIRGTPKLKWGNGDEWAQWKKAAREKHPMRYWIAEIGLNRLEKAFTWPARQIQNVKCYIKNRYIYKTHVLASHTLRPGFWHEFDARMLHCAFDSLVDFVERDLAAFTAFRENIDGGTSPDVLEEVSHREIFALYNWWKYERPVRPDPYDASGYREISARKRAANIGIGQTVPRDVATREEISSALKINREIRQNYYQEDQQMLIRLVNIRSSVWA